MKMALPCLKIAFLFFRMIGEPARGIRSPVLEQQISVGWYMLVYTSQQIPLNQTHTNPYNIPAKQNIPNFVGQSYY